MEGTYSHKTLSSHPLGWKFATQKKIIKKRSTLQNLSQRWPQGSIFAVIWSSQTTTISHGRLRYLQKSSFGWVRFCSTIKSIQKFLYGFIMYITVYTCILITSYPLKSLWITENNKHLCLQWNEKFGAIFDGSVFSMKWSIFMLLTVGIFHLVKNCIHRPIVKLSEKLFIWFKTCSSPLETREVD